MTTYLDHAATTPVRPVAAAAFAEALEQVGNPSSLHAAGRTARRLVEEARESIAADLGAHPTEVIVTAGGTEADNLAIQGIWRARAGGGRRGLVISAVEHPAVLEPAQWLAAHEGADLIEVGVDSAGRLDLDDLERSVTARTAVVSVMWANNEVGTIQPIERVVEAAVRAGAPVHSDAVQAVGQVPVDFAASGLDALTASGHKLGAPIGIGVLLVRRELGVTPVLHGGGQERAVRSGTVPVPGIRAFAAALHEAVAAGEAEAVRLRHLQEQVIDGVLGQIPDVHLRGTPAGPGRLPGNAHFSVPGADADALLFALDAAGVCASSGSACQAGVQQPSHVLAAMGDDDGAARSGLRLTLGWTSSEEDVQTVLAALPAAVQQARAAFRPRKARRQPQEDVKVGS
ncbi:cysteine desulfurase family protein [Ruania halotolerans]|uniref:cysteine desulfurase family protein n=1 Tax=Ruania halotolerans TaxID=2897773 RepID=UPI001E49560B|nr:cysteine desulfurase family protein [Ruania halotolerans]UFU07689.1 cysteine desulfurase [Ruania halotolerans]